MPIASRPNLTRFFAVIGVASVLMAASGIVPVYGGEKVLHAFRGRSDGELPFGGLIADGEGNLLGTTGIGGGSGYQGSGCGTIFELAPDTTETVLYAFQGGNDGWGPTGSLLSGGSGILYGATESGGGATACENGCGTIFKYAPGGTETVLYAFQGRSDGYIPWGSLIADKSGNLFGVTVQGGNYSGSECAQGGCGTVFEVQPNGNKITLYAFQGGTDGANPFGGGLIADASGNLYGTTFSGGGCSANSGDCGTVFKVTPEGAESVLHAFQGDNDGMFPEGGLVADGAGNLYGTTSFGGSCGCGTVFKVTPAGKETLLYSFQAGSDGANPEAGLILDQKGNLYGTTLAGGNNSCDRGGCGTVFKVTPKGEETVLYAFRHTHGANPQAALLLGTHGDLYGTTTAGSTYKYGVVFELKK